MTNSNPSAGNDPARPVTDYENREANGLALAGDDIFKGFIEKTEALRERQASYRDSLPTDPAEKVAAVRRIWMGDDYFQTGTLREAQAIGFALESMVESCDPENIPEERDAMRWFASRLIECQKEEARRIRLAMDLVRG